MTATSARPARLALALGLALLSAPACAASAPADAPKDPAAAAPSPGPTVVIETAAGARHAVTVELARTPNEQARGLMFRESLADAAGMLFIFPVSGLHSFWMRNTLIPLDLIFISDDGRIIGIVERARPRDETPRGPGEPSRYVLEVNGGWCAARGVKSGDRVTFKDVLL